MGTNTNRANLVREILGVVFRHHTCTNMRKSHRDNLIEKVMGAEPLRDWDLSSSYSYEVEPNRPVWELRVSVGRIDERIEDTTGDKVAIFSATFILTNEQQIRAGHAHGITPMLWLGAELDSLRAELVERFGGMKISDVVQTKEERLAAERREEEARFARKLAAICEPLRKNMRVSPTERSFDRKWFEGIPDGRHVFTVTDGDVDKSYVVRLTTTTARLQRTR